MSRSEGNNKPKNKSTSKRKSTSKNSVSAKGNAPMNKKPKPFIKSDKPKPKPKVVSNPDEMRLNKYISNSGVCSRRDADIYIQSGNVKVNGIAITEMGYKVKLTDKVEFDGARLSPEKKEYILLNKPKNFSTSGDDDMSSTNVMELVRGATKGKIQPVGRMDKTTTGLLLFTNDTDIVRKFTEAQQRSSKLYHVTLDKNLKYEDLEKIANGLIIDDYKIFVEEIATIEDQPKSEVGIKMKTANIKLVRKIFEHLNYNVIKLDRVTFAGLTKKNLPRGNWRFLTDQEIINLKNI